MSIKVDQYWWKELFDDIYLLTDARSVENEKLTQEEVNFLEQTLLVDKSTTILDMCGGQGRHSLELSRRGFIKVFVLDYSRYLIALGTKRAKKEGLNTTFIQSDARNCCLHAESFNFILIMASSFGYFPQENENQKILSEVYRILKPEGKLLLDLPDKDYVIKNFKSKSTHQVNDDLTVRRERELGEDILYSREIVSSKAKGLIRDSNYCTRLYSSQKITELIYSAGFSSVNCKRDFMNRDNEGDYGTMTNRMFVIAAKDIASERY
jgi:D-alanine-D-alanine ligase